MTVSTTIVFTVVDPTHAPVPAHITNVSLSSNTFVESAPDGTVIGAISVEMSDGSFAGTLSLGGVDAAHFAISGSNFVLNGVQSAGTYHVDIIATQADADNSPFTIHSTVTGTEVFTITGITLSGNTFQDVDPSGTVIGTISVQATGGVFAGSLSLSGTDASAFSISGGSLRLQGTHAAGTYHFDIIATQVGAVGSPFTAAQTITGEAVVLDPPPPPNADNTITIANKSGVTQTNYPWQFGRPFLEGEIANYPQVLIDGVPIATQADIKNRHPDGSVKFAILAVVISSVPSAGSLDVTFQNQASGHNTALSKADMLDAAYNFDARMQLAFPALVQGVPETTIATWKAVTNGALAVVIDGVAHQITGLDFSAVASLDNISAKLAAAFTTAAISATVTISTLPPVARITTTAAGSGHTIALGVPTTGTNIASLLIKSGAVIAAGADREASARTILNTGHYKLWASGGIAQTVEIADDTAARTYDLGNGDGFHPFRPRFYATFWPGLHKVYVRYLGENNLTTELEDLKYALTLTIGNTSPSTVYTIDLTGGPTNNKLHWFNTRWTKRFWIGGTPEPKININHNLAYLSATKWLPNFDTSLTVPEPTIAAQYAGWIKGPRDFYDASWNGKGIWQSAMGAAGGRGEIAPYPEWNVFELYTGDWRMRDFAVGMTDLAAAFPANLREGHTTKRLSRNDVALSGTGLGRAISITDRKTLCLASVSLYNYAGTLAADKATVVGPITEKWTYNQAHEPAPFFVDYVLTGDPWYLDQMYMWAGFGATQANGAAASNSSGRGPTGAEGVLTLQLRGQGWAIRSRAEVAWAAPDGAPEKEYFTYLITDACARWEGGLRISGTVLDGNAVKTWGMLRGNYFSANAGPVAGLPPILHNWESNGNPTVANATVQQNEQLGYFQVGAVGSFTSPWMLFYCLYGFGRVKELGFDAIDGTLTYTAKWFTDTILHTGHPKLLRVYQMPVEKKGGGFMTYNDIMTTGLVVSYLNTQLPVDFAADLKPDGRTMWAEPGMAMAVDFGISEAVAAYAWYKTNVYDVIVSKNTNPKWAIVPRG